MILNSQTKKLLGVLTASFLLSGTALATPVLLGSVQHNYGSDAGRLAPTSFTTSTTRCDTLNSSSVTVQGNSSASDCQRFADAFDFSGIAFDNIDHFGLELAFSGAKNQIFTLENWHVRPGYDYQHAVSEGIGSSLANNGPQTFTFDDSPSSLGSNNVFDNIVNNEAFFLWFDALFPSSTEFDLKSARLDVFGVAAAPSVPEPTNLGLALLGAALLGLGLRRRSRTFVG